jgi:hypothetical protein
MMSGLIFAGIDPVKAIKYQIMVTFMLLSTASLSTIIAGYLTYRKFYNARHQLVVTQLKKRDNLFCRPGKRSATGLFLLVQQRVQLTAILRASASPVPSAARISCNILRPPSAAPKSFADG